MTTFIHVIVGSFIVGAAVIYSASHFRPKSTSTSELWALYKIQFLIVLPVLTALFAGSYILYFLLFLLGLRGGWELIEMYKSRVTVKSLVLMVTAMLMLASVLGFIGMSGQVAVNREAMLIVYILAEVGDSFALLVGKTFGRTFVFPKLSPKKTLEGLFAGVFSTLIVAYGISYISDRLSVVGFLILGLFVFSLGLLGDLAVSAYKRWHGRKDFLPVSVLHGGVIDIYDSFLFSALILIPVGLNFGWIEF